MLLASCVLAASASRAQAEPPLGPMFQELGHHVDYFIKTGAGQFAKADLDHDGVMDLAVGGVATHGILLVLGKRPNGSLGIKQTIITPDVPDYYDGFARIIAWHRSPEDQIVTVGTTGMVRIYGGNPLSELDSFPIENDAVSAAIGDVDADGSDDLLVLTSGSVYAYALDDGSLEWSTPINSGRDIALAQLDGDSALEIIVAGPQPGVVLDGATRATDWAYANGFGVELATGVFSPGGNTEWVGAKAWYEFNAFRAEPWAQLWSGSTNQDIGAVATGDIDGYGVDSILYGDGQSGEIHVIDPATHQQRFAITNPGYSTNAIAVGDIDGDHQADIAVADSSRVPLTVANAKTGQTLWSFAPTSSPYTIAAMGDVDGDGRDEIVATAWNKWYHSSIFIFDAATGTREWESPDTGGNSDDPFSISVYDIALSPHAGGPGMDIVLAGEGIYYGKMIVVDGVDKTITRHIGQSQSPEMPFRVITGVRLTDYDHDGVQDYVFALQPVGGGASGVKLCVFSGSSGTKLWESTAIGSDTAKVNGVLIVPAETEGGATELVEELPDRLRAYNSDSQMLDWVLAANNDGAAYIDKGLAGHELMLYQDNGAVSFYDAETQNYLRAFALPSPLGGITALQDDARILLAASNENLMFVDGSSGEIKATSKTLRTLIPRVKPAASPVGNDSWRIAMPTQAALWRMRLDGSDQIFTGSFEGP